MSLSSNVIQHAIAALVDEEPYESLTDLKSNLYGVEVILQACGNLLIEEAAIIRPIHFSVQEYFTKSSPLLPHDHPFDTFSSAGAVHEKLSEACFPYLRLAISPPSSCIDAFAQLDRIYAAPFSLYAAQSFDIHVEASVDDFPRVLEMTNSFLESDSDFLGSILQIKLAGPDFWTRDETRFLKIGFDVSAITIIFASNLFNVKCLQARHTGSEVPKYAMHHASVAGVYTVVERLLNEHCDPNEVDEVGSSPLYHASEHGHEAIVELLVSRDVEVGTQAGFFGNALQSAAYHGHTKIVQILLDKGADVNAEGGEYDNALQAASRGGYYTIVQMLLDQGADVNAQGEYFGNALEAASLGSNDNIVQILLEKGANVNAEGGEFGNALGAASWAGNVNIIQILLDKGADVNAEGGLYGNAIIQASSRGHEGTVEMLLSRGADVNAQGPRGNALQTASYKGHEKVVQILLDRGADINACNIQRCGGNALQSASRSGHEKIVQMILDKGADINAEGSRGSPLRAASY